VRSEAFRSRASVESAFGRRGFIGRPVVTGPPLSILPRKVRTFPLTNFRCGFHRCLKHTQSCFPDDIRAESSQSGSFSVSVRYRRECTSRGHRQSVRSNRDLQVKLTRRRSRNPGNALLGIAAHFGVSDPTAARRKRPSVRNGT
jgi:hypothetical protein